MGKSPTLFGRRLKEARMKAGLSQKGLGLEIGLDASVASARMNQYEVGSHHPKFQTAVKIAEVLNVPTGYFFTEDDLLASMIEPWQNLSTANKRKLLRQMQEMLPE